MLLSMKGLLESLLMLLLMLFLLVLVMIGSLRTAAHCVGVFDVSGDIVFHYVDVDGDSNAVTFNGSGYAGGYFYLDQTGNSRTFNIQQLSTLDNDWLKILSTGSSGTVCVIQNDNGTAVGC